MKMRISQLRDITGMLVTMEVKYPVVTPTGPTTVDDDDDVEVAFKIAPGITLYETITVQQYRGLARLREAQGTQALPFPEPA